MSGKAVATPICGAKTKQGGRCKMIAGHRTPHPGQGKCYRHGGMTPIKHGRYSSISRPEIAELIEKYAADPDPLNLLPELAALRALFQDYIERYDAMREALLAWHASFAATQRVIPPHERIAFERTIDELEARYADEADTPKKSRADLALARAFVTRMAEPVGEGKPRQLLDLVTAKDILAEIGNMVQRIEKVRAENAISRGDLLRVMTEMGRVVHAYVPDEKTQAKIRDAWLTIRL